MAYMSFEPASYDRSQVELPYTRDLTVPSQNPYGARSFDAPADQSPALRQPYNPAAAIEDERQYRKDGEVSGYGDMMVGGFAVAASIIGEGAQTNLEQLQAAGRDHPGSSLFDVIASAPWDWKALAVATGTYVVLTTAPRVVRSVRFQAEADRTLDQIHSAEGFIPNTQTQTRRSRIMRRVARGAVAILGAVVAYKAGEHAGLEVDMATSVTLLGLAAASVYSAKASAGRHERRREAQRQAYDAEFSVQSEIEY